MTSGGRERDPYTTRVNQGARCRGQRCDAASAPPGEAVDCAPAVGLFDRMDVPDARRGGRGGEAVTAAERAADCSGTSVILKAGSWMRLAQLN